MINDVLGYGKENAISAKVLARHFNVSVREVTRQIEKERRNGKPICAEVYGKHRGYYLAATAEELDSYCNCIKGRAVEIFKTRQALIKILKEYAEVKNNAAD